MNPPVCRVMAIDYGEVRIGLALSDEIGLLAHPLETVPGENKARAAERIAHLAREKSIGTLLMGLPLRMDGTEGTAVEKVRAFVKRLRPLLPESVEILEVDERLSTVSAMAKMREAGRTEKSGRRQIDQAAAMEILQEFLDMRPGAGVLADDAWGDDFGAGDPGR
jgi:putative holliday junction resolvase